MSESFKKYTKVQVRDADWSIWRKMRPKLIEAVREFLDSVIDDRNNKLIREETVKFTEALLEFGKDKIKDTSKNNVITIAEIDRIYGQKRKANAEIRKLNAESDAIEIKNNIKRLYVAMAGMKMLISGIKNEEEIIFSRQIDAFLKVLKRIESDNLPEN
ncbi:hypothetical protein [uncultured Dokdonia sp.]|uniref:hypothetical protein n=1 Tax=uncultured Dokdonia sp. TaxID=575653 RepID=UPI002628BF7E|nr:hypothetical protein [uncultured Dokdonia sp.]